MTFLDADIQYVKNVFCSNHQKTVKNAPFSCIFPYFNVISPFWSIFKPILRPDLVCRGSKNDPSPALKLAHNILDM